MTLLVVMCDSSSRVPFCSFIRTSVWVTVFSLESVDFRITRLWHTQSCCSLYRYVYCLGGEVRSCWMCQLGFQLRPSESRVLRFLSLSPHGSLVCVPKKIFCLFVSGIMILSANWNLTCILYKPVWVLSVETWVQLRIRRFVEREMQFSLLIGVISVFRRRSYGRYLCRRPFSGRRRHSCLYRSLILFRKVF